MKRGLTLFALWILDWTQPFRCGSNWAVHVCPTAMPRFRARTTPVCGCGTRLTDAAVRQHDGVYRCNACKSKQ